MSLEVVTPTGEIINTLPVPRHASGPDLTMMFLGSEGTLGVITKVCLKIHPKPEERQFRAYLFKDFHTAMSAGADLMRSRLRPCAVRLYDETETLTHVKKVFGIDIGSGAYLVFGFDGNKDIVELQMKHAREIMEGKYKGTDLGSKGGDLWWKNKYKFFYPGYMFHLPQAFGTLDTVADFAHIEKVYWAMKKVVNEKFPKARFIGHFSHWYEWGCMLYARFIFEGKDVPQDPPRGGGSLQRRLGRRNPRGNRKRRRNQRTPRRGLEARQVHERPVQKQLPDSRRNQEHARPQPHYEPRENGTLIRKDILT